jgi:hypothetical protein
VGAAFVSAIAGTLVVADILRELHQAEPYSMIGCDLRDVDVRAVQNKRTGEAPGNPAYDQLTDLGVDKTRRRNLAAPRRHCGDCACDNRNARAWQM